MVFLVNREVTLSGHNADLFVYRIGLDNLLVRVVDGQDKNLAYAGLIDAHHATGGLQGVLSARGDVEEADVAAVTLQI